MNRVDDFVLGAEKRKKKEDEDFIHSIMGSTANSAIRPNDFGNGKRTPQNEPKIDILPTLRHL